MQNFDLHMHTSYTDAVNSPREMIEAAISCGFNAVGISEHSHTPHDDWWCLSPENSIKYREEMKVLKEEYFDKIEVLCGIEMDFYSDEEPDNYDYVIGSVHYIRVKDEGQRLVEGTLRYEGFIYIPIDEDTDRLRASADEYFGGDIYSLLELYFETSSHLIAEKEADIVGHFDLIKMVSLVDVKNSKEPLFDETHPRYIAAWQKAADKLIADSKLRETKEPVNRLAGSDHPIFEINRSAKRKGLEQVTYPSDEMIRYIKERGGMFIDSSDGHATTHLGFN